MTPLEQRRAEGKLTVEDEAHILRLDHDNLKRADEPARRVLAPIVEKQIAHYEAARAKANAG